jgi:hypothetical protein
LNRDASIGIEFKVHARWKQSELMCLHGKRQELLNVRANRLIGWRITNKVISRRWLDAIDAIRQAYR